MRGYKIIEGNSAEEVESKLLEEIRKAADAGIAMVGGRKALDAALATQHQLCAEFFKVVKQSVEYAQEHNQPPLMPLTSEVMELYNNAAGALLMIAELMGRGVLYEKDEQDFDRLETTPPCATRH